MWHYTDWHVLRAHLPIEEICYFSLMLKYKVIDWTKAIAFLILFRWLPEDAPKSPRYELDILAKFLFSPSPIHALSSSITWDLEKDTNAIPLMQQHWMSSVPHTIGWFLCNFWNPRPDGEGSESNRCWLCEGNRLRSFRRLWMLYPFSIFSTSR